MEGREFFAPLAIALDTSTNPPALYVSDTRNSRVLGFRSATGFANGQPADVVLGQPDFATTLEAGPGQTNTQPTGLTLPGGIAVDTQGNVYVVDSGNNRVLRFPRPFAQVGASMPDIALGQSSFSTNGPNQGGVSASTVAFTTSGAVLLAGIAFDSSGNLWVSDAGNNRVLRFNAKVLGSHAASGPSADIVLGQADFVSDGYNLPPTSPATSLNAFTSPSGIAFDSAGRLFVGESVPTTPGRILMWTPPFSTGQAAARIVGVDTSQPGPPAVSEFQFAPSPGGLFPIGNSIGVTDTSNNRILDLAASRAVDRQHNIPASYRSRGPARFRRQFRESGIARANREHIESALRRRFLRVRVVYRGCGQQPRPRRAPERKFIRSRHRSVGTRCDESQLSQPCGRARIRF